MAARTLSSLEYLKAVTADPALAIIPFQMAGDIWGVSRAAVDGMVRSGKLLDIKIDGTRFILAKSLQALVDQWQAEVATIRKALESSAKKGNILYYSPLMESIGLSSTVPADRKRIGDILGQISEATRDENGTLLSVIVHRQSSGETNPGPGFFALARGLGFKWQDDKRLVQEETEKVWSHYQR